MKPSEIGALLRLLDKHPRVTSISVGDVTIGLAEAPPVLTEGTAEEAGGELELPPGTPDPRAAIRALYKKLGRTGQVPT